MILICTPNSEGKVLQEKDFEKYKFKVKILIEKRRGYGRAYKSGMENLLDTNLENNYLVITGDADGTYPFELSNELINIFNLSKLDFLNCGRLKLLQKGSMSFRNLIGNYLLTFGIEVLFLRKINDSQSGMWIFNKKFVEKIMFHKLGDGMELSFQIKVMAIRLKNIVYGETEVPYFKRIGNEPQLRWFRDALRIVFKAIKFRFIKIS